MVRPSDWVPLGTFTEYEERAYRNAGKTGVLLGPGDLGGTWVVMLKGKRRKKSGWGRGRGSGWLRQWSWMLRR